MLVSRSGSVDWACLPRFASPSVFGRLLDAERGGACAIRPVGPYRSRQRYLGSTCLLATEFRLPGRRLLELVDFMPIFPGASHEGRPLIVRRVRAEGGAIRARFDCTPAFNYGRAGHRWTVRRGRATARAGPNRLEIQSDLDLRADGASVRGAWEAMPGSSVYVVLGWGTLEGSDLDAERMLDATTQFWTGWVHSERSPFHQVAHRWHPWVARSELTLKLLSHADTGAFVAAPTTSVPERPGGSRNWDYRYVWIRDAAFAAQAMLHLGHLAEARAFLRWVLLRVREDGSHRLRVVYGAHGETDLRERELAHWRGLWDSRPVRVGNAAAGQFQLDIYGELLDAALLLDRLDPAFVGEHWAELAGIAQVVVRRWRYPDRGIWEVRGPPQQFVHSKLMAWVALDRATQLAERRDARPELEAWSNEAQKVRAWMLADGLDAARNTFVRAAGRPEADAANLRIPLVGFLPFDDPSVLGTIDAIAAELSDGPFLYRYRAPDGLDPGEGTFLPAAFWLVECLARAGRVAEARERWTRLLRAGSRLMLFSEEYDPASASALGNFPQALTHVALLRAASALGESEAARASARAAERHRPLRPPAVADSSPPVLTLSPPPSTVR